MERQGFLCLDKEFGFFGLGSFVVSVVCLFSPQHEVVRMLSLDGRMLADAVPWL